LALAATHLFQAMADGFEIGGPSDQDWAKDGFDCGVIHCSYDPCELSRREEPQAFLFLLQLGVLVVNYFWRVRF
jgi:hypothetical protein